MRLGLRGFAAIGLLGFIAYSFGGSEETFIHLNKVVAELEKQKTVTGIWVQGVSLSTAIGIIEYNGYPDAEVSLSKPMIDFVLVEMKHEPFDVTGRAFRSSGSPIRRTSRN